MTTVRKGLVLVGVLVVSLWAANCWAGLTMEQVLAAYPAAEQKMLARLASHALNSGVPQAEVVAVLERGRERQVAAGDVKSFLAIMAATAGAKLDTELVTNKIMEGLAKGVPPATIRMVARQTAQRLARAREVMERCRECPKVGNGRGHSARVKELALSLERREMLGEMKELSILFSQRGGSVEDLTAASGALVDLVDLGMGHKQALDLVKTAVIQGVDRRGLLKLVQATAMAKRRGMPPGEFGPIAKQKLDRGEGPEALLSGLKLQRRRGYYRSYRAVGKPERLQPASSRGGAQAGGAEPEPGLSPEP